jgi:hypothetical protein
MRDRAFLLSRRSAFLDNGHGRWCMCVTSENDYPLEALIAV